MAWIESHQALGQHPKTLALAAALHCTLPTAVGHLQYLWWWALDYAPDGLVTARTRPVAIRACQVQRQPERFWSALVEAGFVDVLDELGPTWRIHDWREYTGRLIDQRWKNAERKRESRRRVDDVRVTSGGQDTGRPENGTADVRRPSQGYQHNQPDRTGHNQPETTGSSLSGELNTSRQEQQQPRAYARETAQSPELIAEHLYRLEQERIAAATAAKSDSLNETKTDG